MAARKAAQKNLAGKAKVTSDALEQMAAATPTVAPTMRSSRGAVAAPGKRHRKPPPQERLDQRMGEPVGKKMGQKSPKGRIRSGRG